MRVVDRYRLDCDASTPGLLLYVGFLQGIKIHVPANNSRVLRMQHIKLRAVSLQLLMLVFYCELSRCHSTKRDKLKQRPRQERDARLHPKS